MPTKLGRDYFFSFTDVYNPPVQCPEFQRTKVCGKQNCCLIVSNFVHPSPKYC